MPVYSIVALVPPRPRWSMSRLLMSHEEWLEAQHPTSGERLKQLPEPHDEWMSIIAVGKMMGIKHRHVYNLFGTAIRSGEIKTTLVKDGRNYFRYINLPSLAKYREEHPCERKTPGSSRPTHQV
jgi:hypothetical protein